MTLRSIKQHTMLTVLLLFSSVISLSGNTFADSTTNVPIKKVLAVTAVPGANGQVLEFLNLVQTAGLSPMQAIAEFTGYGFHWANAREVNLLLSAFNLTQVAGGPFQVVPNNLSDIQTFLKLVGETPSFPSDIQTPSARAFYNDELADNIQRFVQVTEGPTSFPTEPPSVANNRFEGCDDNCAADAVGVFLVRRIFIIPTSRDQCMNGGWTNFGFPNQGLCISSVAAYESPGAEKVE